MIIIKNTTKDTVLAEHCLKADNFFSRFIGLMRTSELRQGHGLIITPCNSIHMFFMKIPLDIIFTDSNNRVVHLIEDIKPWRISKIVQDARSVIELPVGTINMSRTSVGDTLNFHINA